MQSSVPGLMDMRNEPRHVLDMYGTKGSRRLLCRQLFARAAAGRVGASASSSSTTATGTTTATSPTTSALRPRKWTSRLVMLVTDLKNRGMLDETLVIWGGEFGRTPMAQGNGRDHIKGFSIWLAGGGIRGGITHGATDELGYNAFDVVHVHDLHATMSRSARRRPQETHLQVPGPRLPPDGRARSTREKDPRVMA